MQIRRFALRCLTASAIVAAPLGFLGVAQPASAIGAGGGGCSTLIDAGHNVAIKACITKTPPLTTYPSKVVFTKKQVNVLCHIVTRIHEANTENVTVDNQFCETKMLLGGSIVMPAVQQGCITGHRYLTEVSVAWRAASGSQIHSLLVKSPILTC